MAKASRPPAHVALGRVPLGCPLSPAEFDVMLAIADGLSQKQVAARLGRTPSTVRSHSHHACQRLGVGSAVQVIIACIKSGWMVVDDGGRGLVGLRLDRVLDGIVRIVKARRQLTDSQRVVLDSFDELLKARDDGANTEARKAMDDAVAVMLHEAGVPPNDRPRRDLVELIADYLCR